MTTGSKCWESTMYSSIKMLDIYSWDRGQYFNTFARSSDIFIKTVYSIVVTR